MSKKIKFVKDYSVLLTSQETKIYHKDLIVNCRDEEKAQKVIDNADQYSPEEVAAARRLVGASVTEQASRSQGGRGTASAAGGQEAWLKARNSVAVGQNYVGPDGQTYTRKQ